MASDFALGGTLNIESRPYQRGMAKASKATRDTADDVDDLTNKLEDDLPEAGRKGGTNAGDLLGSGFKKAVGAAGIATFLVSAMQDGFDRMQVRARFEQEFGLVGEDAKRLGGEAAELFGRGWGDSTEDVMRAIGQVDQALVKTRQISEDETKKIARGALGIAEVFRVDVDQVIRSTSQLLLNGLAPDAETALDLVVNSLQNGANKAGDFFESIDEYSQHFGGFGLSAQDMFAIFEHGIQNGQRDLDKMADAVKEMSIRAVEDTDEVSQAYQRLGLDADDYRRRILAGGDDARDAYVTIMQSLTDLEDPADRHTTAVALIGTQYEDLGRLGLESLSAIEDEYDDVTGKAEDLATAIEGSESELQLFWRRSKSVLGQFGELLAGSANDWVELIGGIPDLLSGGSSAVQEQEDHYGNLVGRVEDYTSALEVAQQVIDAAPADSMFAKTADVNELAARLLADALLAQAVATEDAEDGVIGLTGALPHAADALADTADASDDVADASDASAAAFEDQAKAAKELRDELDELTEAKADLVGGDIAVRNAARDADEALDGFRQTARESATETREYAQALDDATDAQLDAARVSADYRIAQREAAGEVLTAQQKVDEFRAALVRQSDTLGPGGPVRKRLDAYTADLDAIPGDVVTTFIAGTGVATAEMSAYQELITGTPGSWSTKLQAEPEQGAWGRLIAWKSQIDAIPSSKTTTVRVISSGSGTPTARASGGLVHSGIPYMVGEEGPEPFVPSMSGRIVSNHRASALGVMSAHSARSGAYSTGTGSPTPATSGVVATGRDVVQVFIGGKEITDLVDTRIERRESSDRMLR